MRSTALRVYFFFNLICMPFHCLTTDNYIICSLLLSETTCSEIRYQCNSGSCIMKKNAKCDGVHDCQDHSDEADCGERSALYSMCTSWSCSKKKRNFNNITTDCFIIPPPPFFLVIYHATSLKWLQCQRVVWWNGAKLFILCKTLHSQDSFSKF